MSQIVVYDETCVWQEIDDDGLLWQISKVEGDWELSITTNSPPYTLIWKGTKSQYYGSPPAAGTKTGDTPEGFYGRLVDDAGGCNLTPESREVVPICVRMPSDNGSDACQTYEVVVSGLTDDNDVLNGNWVLKQFPNQYFWSSKNAGGSSPPGVSAEDPNAEMVIYSDGRIWIVELHKSDLCFFKFEAELINTITPPDGVSNVKWLRSKDLGSETQISPPPTLSIIGSDCPEIDGSQSYSSSSSVVLAGLESSSSSVNVYTVCTDNDTTLRRWFTFEEGTGTTVGNTGLGGDSSDNLTSTSTGTLPVWVTPGKIGTYALRYNRNAQSSGGTNNMFGGAFGVAHPYTVAFWVNFDSLPSDNAEESLLFMGIEPVNTYRRIVTYYDSGVRYLKYEPFGYVWPMPAMTTGTWNHFAITYEPNPAASNNVGRLKTYVNGVVDINYNTGGATMAVLPGEANSIIEIGGFTGMIDDVRVYNTTLSDTLIAALAGCS